MIFVTVGTGKFEELIKKIDEIAPKFKEKIIAQIGNGRFIPKNMDYFRYKPSLRHYYKKARLVISHGGAGTTYELLAMNKKLISIANPRRTDVHQQDILKALSEEGYLMWCKDIDKLDKCIISAPRFRSKKYKQPKCEIALKIKKFLSK